MRSFSSLFAVFFLSLALVGCGKDKNLEDYQRDKLQQNLGLYKSKEGIYSGIVRSKLDGRVIGAMQISFSAQTKTRPSNDGQLSLGSPILVGNVQFLDKNVINLVAPEGFYDPNSNLYHADIPISRGGAGGGGSSGGGAGDAGGSGGANGNPGNFGNSPVTPNGTALTENVTISGQLLQETLVGEVQSQNYPEYGGRFELTRNGGDLRSLLAQVRPGDRRHEEEDASKVTSFTGTTLFRNASNSDAQPARAARIVLTRQTYNTSEDFLDLISPIKFVQASINYSDSLKLLFPKAVYDTRQGYLTAQTLLTLNGQSNQMTIDCHQEGNELNCTHLTSGGGVAATTRATLDTGLGEDPVDNSGTLRAVTKTFFGQGDFYPGQLSKVRLVVTFPARTKRQELLELFFPVSEYSLIVSVRFTESVSPSFTNVKWDTVNGLLDASIERTGNGSYTQQLQCSNFYFLAQTERFNCSFFSSRSPLITMTFDPSTSEPRRPAPTPAPVPKKKKRRH
jgi:hypothetical protein